MGTSTFFDTNPNDWTKPGVAPWLGTKTTFGAAPIGAPGNASFDTVFNEGKFWNGLDNRYLLQNQGTLQNQLDSTGLNELQKEATATPGTSAWEQMMLGKQGLEQANARDIAAANSASGLTSAYSNLASHGGLSTGARERLAKTGAQDLAASRQQVARQGALDRLGIGAQAEQNRLGLLQQLPGAELNAANYKTGIDTSNRDYATGIQNTNITNNLAALSQRNANDQNTYAQQMQDWAAMNAAKATAKGGGKGGGGK